MILKILCLIVVQNLAVAQMEKPHEQALQETKTMLRSPEQRKQAIQNDHTALEIDSKVEALAGSPDNKEEIYDVAADVFQTISTKAKGDPEKMQQMLLEAQSNPQAFYRKYFNSEQKARVRGLAGKIERQKASPQRPPR